MFVSKKRYRELEKENGQQALIISKQDAMINDLMHNEQSDNDMLNGLREELEVEKSKNATLERKCDKDKILKEVRARLLKELREFKDKATKEKFKCIGYDGKHYPVEVAHEKGFEIMHFSLIESIAAEIESDIEKYSEGVVGELLG